MNRWLRRLGYLGLGLLWLMVMAFPTFAFFLATQGEIQIGEDPRQHLRFFLVQEEEAGGIGIEWVRGARRVENCTQTTIRYLLWEGGAPGNNVTFCQCFDPIDDTPLAVEESICTP